MRYKQPTEAQEQMWKDWIAERPESMRAVCARFDPWTLYRMKSTGQRVTLLALSEPDENGKFTCRVLVSGEFNFVSHERAVFGIDVDDLEECDLPGPDEQLGTMEIPTEVLRSLNAQYPNGPSKAVLAELMLKYPVRKVGNGKDDEAEDS